MTELIGIHDSMTAADYHALPYCSNSALNVLAKQSPAHLIHQRTNPKPPTPDMVLGSAVHCLILEPREFDRRYAIASQCAASKRDGARCEHPGIYVVVGEWRCGTHSKAGERLSEGLTILTGEDYDTARRMRDAAFAHPEVGEALQDIRRAEVAATWKDSETGILCKALWDAPFAEARLMLDLKTARDANAAAWLRAAEEHGYHTQAAFYTDGAAELGVLFDRFAFVVMEKEPPFACRVFEASKQFMEWGRRDVRERIAVYAKCLKANDWPAYEDEIIEPPPWVARKLEQV